MFSHRFSRLAGPALMSGGLLWITIHVMVVIAGVMTGKLVIALAPAQQLLLAHIYSLILSVSYLILAETFLYHDRYLVRLIFSSVAHQEAQWQGGVLFQPLFIAISNVAVDNDISLVYTLLSIVANSNKLRGVYGRSGLNRRFAARSRPVTYPITAQLCRLLL